MARELPIFPLPIVLFPGAPQPLHIFEPRYRQLLQDCIAADLRDGFGRLARALGVLTEREDEEIELATDPQLLSFQVAASLELEAPAKQALQAIRSTSARLRQLANLLGPVAADAERRAAVRQQARGNGRGGRHPEIERATGPPEGDGSGGDRWPRRSARSSARAPCVPRSPRESRHRAPGCRRIAASPARG